MRAYLPILMSMAILLLSGCKKENAPLIPELTPATLSNMIEITLSTATFSGDITSDGGAPIIARGVCWDTMDMPTITDNKTSDGTGTGKFTSVLTNLAGNTKYYVRAYATNSAGTSYGTSLSFTTLPESGEIVKDIDGNIYHTVTIGSQVWLLENLKTTRYRNGDAIPYDTIGITTPGTVKGSYCYSNHDTANFRIYGCLYNWYAVDDNRNIAPIGWHVSTDYDWSILISFAGGRGIAGGKLKEAGTMHWFSPNTDATNEFGFFALPGGCRLNKQYNFFSLTGDGRWWTATENPEANLNAWLWTMFAYDKNVDHLFNGKVFWLSVRCVRD